MYHIIPPLDDGADHPDNYRVLPDSIPADYHLGEGRALWHQIGMLRLLGPAIVKKALVASVGKERAAEKFETLLDREEQFKGVIRPPLKRPGGSDAAAAAAGAEAPGGVPSTPAHVPGDASAAHGSPAAGQEASEARPSDGAGPSKRPRTESEAPADARQEQQEGVMEG